MLLHQLITAYLLALPGWLALRPLLAHDELAATGGAGAATAASTSAHQPLSRGELTGCVVPGSGQLVAVAA